MAICPAHEDRMASLSIKEGNGGRVLLHCFAGCDAPAVVKALGLRMADLFPKDVSGGPGARLENDPLGSLARRRGWSRESLVALGAVGAGAEVRFPMRSAGGETVGWRRRRGDGTEFEGGSKALSKKGGRNGILSPWPIPAEGVVLVVEGEADAAAALTAGWDAVVATPGAEPGKNVFGFLEAVLAGREVVLAPDPGEAGTGWRGKLEMSLAKAGCKVRFIPPLDEDLDERLRRESDRGSALRALVDNALPTGSSCASTRVGEARRDIVLGDDEGRVNDEALDALRMDPNLFQRAEALVEIRGGEMNRAPVIRALAVASLRDRVSRYAKFMVLNKDRELVPAHPPKWCVDALYARGTYPGIRPLEGIAEAPVLLPGGEVLDRPGYDERSGLFLIPATVFPPIPAKPTLDEARHALEELRETIADFPFESEEHASGALAAILTPIARRAHTGSTPLFAVDASTRGSGKTLLCNVVSTIFTGRPMPTSVMASDDDEMRKRITASVLGGESLVLFDNVAGALGCPSLDAVLTTGVWRDRILGRSANTEAMPIHIVWFTTGNNLSFRGDTARRSLHVRLDPRMERPEERNDFTHKNLLAYCARERPRLYVAGVTALRAYFAAGSPDQDLSAWGSFEGWSGVVRSALVWAGYADPVAACLEIARTADPGASALRQLLHGLRELDPEGRGLLAAEILRRAELDAGDGRSALLSVIEELAANGRPTPRGLGMKLHHMRGHVVDGMRLERRDGKDGASWFVGSVSPRCVRVGIWVRFAIRARFDWSASSLRWEP